MSDQLQDARQPFVRIDHGVMDRVPEFGPFGLAVYAVLAKHADNASAKCFPSRRAIASESKMSERAVDAAIKSLVSAGVISVAPRTTTTASGAVVKASNVYTLLSVPRKVGQVVRRGGAGGAPGVGQEVPQGGAGGAHRTSLSELASIELASQTASAPTVTAQGLTPDPEPKRRAPRAPKPLFDAFKAAFPNATDKLAGTFDSACVKAGLTVDRWHAFMADRKIKDAYLGGYLTRNNALDRFQAWASSSRRDVTREPDDDGRAAAERQARWLKAQGYA